MENRESKRARRTFSAEFKRDAVRLMQERRARGVPLTQIGRELDVRPDQLRAWTRQIERSEQRLGPPVRDVFPGHGKRPSADEEIRRLKRELEVTRAERDFLKKTAAFFAKESR